MNKWYPIIAAVLVGILFSGVVLLISSRPKGVPITLSNNSTPVDIRFEIYGAIKQPGVYSAPGSLRVEDAINYAGGLSEPADASASNLSARVNDGDKIIIPTKSVFEATITPVTRNSIHERINLNTAVLEDLLTLPGIGEIKANDILLYRDTNGGFTDISDLLNIPGIGEKTIEQFLDLITVE
ncbi:MAG: helix-hairpin-helix domain-containing protein [Flexilinea sp.]